MGIGAAPEGSGLSTSPDLAVLARGTDWVVVAKPPRLLVHRNVHFPRGDAALQRVRSQVRRRVYPIHRLDRPTSGCLLFGLVRERAGALQAALVHPEARKRYVALVRGTFPDDGPVLVETPMRDSRGELKQARSEVWCLGRSVEPRCSLLLVRPHTGRFHQVRRHVRDLNHPVLGDSKHGDTRENRAWREGHGLDRLALHCLSLDLPFDEGSIQATCPLFEDMHAVLVRMPWWDEAVAALPELGLPPLPLPAVQDPHARHRSHSPAAS